MARRLALVWAAILAAFGVLEVWTHRDDTAAALAFWAGTLLGGAALVLTGWRLWARHPSPALSLLALGTLTGMVATAWTILLPVFGVVVLMLAIRALAVSAEESTG